MNTKPKFYNIIIAYAMWIVDIGLSVWLFCARRCRHGLRFITSMGVSPQDVDTSSTRLSVFSSEVILLIYMIVSENYLRVAVGKGFYLAPLPA
jgi:hypothetical protein